MENLTRLALCLSLADVLSLEPEAFPPVLTHGIPARGLTPETYGERHREIPARRGGSGPAPAAADRQV